MTVPSDLAALIPNARDRLKGVARIISAELNQRPTGDTRSEMWLKCEDFRPVCSYRLRGAYNLISQFPPEARDVGVVCMSTGNHGQGAAFATAALGIGVIVYIPTATLRQKCDRIRVLEHSHVELVMEGATYDQASRAATRFTESNDRILMPAFNDPCTIAGQDTAIAEAVEQSGFVLDVVILPVGGGGPVSGATAWSRIHRPQVRIIGVGPDEAPCMVAAISVSRPFPLGNINTFTDGAVVGLVGDHIFNVINEAKIELTRIPEGQVYSETLDMHQTDDVIAEPVGALVSTTLSTDGVDSRVHVPAGSWVLNIISGDNNDVARYADVMKRSPLHKDCKHYFLVSFPQQSGASWRFLDEVLDPDSDTIYLKYVKCSSQEVGLALVGAELSNPGDHRFLLARIAECGMEVNEVDSTSPCSRFLTQRLITVAAGWGGSYWADKPNPMGMNIDRIFLRRTGLG